MTGIFTARCRMSPLSEVEADLKEISRYYRNAKRVFFTGANPFVLSFDKLVYLNQNPQFFSKLNKVWDILI